METYHNQNSSPNFQCSRRADRSKRHVRGKQFSVLSLFLSASSPCLGNCRIVQSLPPADPTRWSEWVARLAAITEPNSSSRSSIVPPPESFHLLPPIQPLSMCRFAQSLLLCLIGLGFGLELGDAFKVPFRINDVLPVLPRQVSWPVLNNLHSAVDLLPVFVGSVTPDNGTIEWKGACFDGNVARLEFTEGDRAEPDLGGGIMHLTVWSLSDLLITIIVHLLQYKSSVFLHSILNIFPVWLLI